LEEYKTLILEEKIMKVNTIPEIKQLIEKLESIDNSQISNIYRIWNIEKEIEQLEILLEQSSSTSLT
jgi:hypothetical protein